MQAIVGSIFGSLVLLPSPPPVLPDEDTPPEPAGKPEDPRIEPATPTPSLLSRLTGSLLPATRGSTSPSDAATDAPAVAASPAPDSSAPSLLSRLTSKASTPSKPPTETPSSERASSESHRPSMTQRMLATEQAHASYRKKSATRASLVPTKPTLQPTFSMKVQMKVTRLMAPVDPAQSPTDPPAAQLLPTQVEQPAAPQPHTVTRRSFGFGEADGGVGKAGLATTKQDQVDLNSSSRVSLEKPKVPRFECRLPSMRLSRSCPGLLFGPGAGEQA